MSINKVVKQINKYSKFLITSHVDAEGDALGSELALSALLKKLGKSSLIINNEKPSSGYSFLPGVKEITTKIRSNDYQAVFVLDCPTSKRTGATAKLIDYKKPIINIDHHIDNSNFGKINWVDAAASCVGEMVYQLFKLTNTKITEKEALCIYVAILTDTGSFRHANTTSKTMQIASELIGLGIKPERIYSRLYENNTVADSRLMSKIISDFSFSQDQQIAWVKINQNIFRKIYERGEIYDKVLTFAKSIKTVKVVFILSQVNRQSVKVSFRSKVPFSVQRIAMVFGGGGHKLAAGCTIAGTLTQAQQLVLKEVRKILR